MPNHVFVYPLERIIKVINATTIRAIVDHGRYIYSQAVLNILGIAPPPAQTCPLEAQFALERTEDWLLRSHNHLFTSITIDKWGRIWGDLTAASLGRSLREYLTDEELVVECKMNTTPVWTKEQLTSIRKKIPGEL